MKGIDFSAVFSNAVDNAIEHERKETKKEIAISVYEKKGYDVISVKNRISKSILETNPNLSSTKNDSEKHGFGVSQIKEIAESYEGMTARHVTRWPQSCMVPGILEFTDLPELYDALRAEKPLDIVNFVREPVPEV